MSKSNLQETGYLKLLFQNIALANIGDAALLEITKISDKPDINTNKVKIKDAGLSQGFYSEGLGVPFKEKT